MATLLSRHRGINEAGYDRPVSESYLQRMWNALPDNSEWITQQYLARCLGVGQLSTHHWAAIRQLEEKGYAETEAASGGIPFGGGYRWKIRRGQNRFITSAEKMERMQRIVDAAIEWHWSAVADESGHEDMEAAVHQLDIEVLEYLHENGHKASWLSFDNDQEQS